MDLILEMYRGVFFHGTPIKFLPPILRKGLILGVGARWTPEKSLNAGKGEVYLTPEIGLAARYAIGRGRTDIPAIIEISISGRKRYKKFRNDPMEDEDENWRGDPDIDTSDDYEGPGGRDIPNELEDLKDLKKAVNRFIKKWTGKAMPSDSSQMRFRGTVHDLADTDYLQQDGVFSLWGIDIYKFILQSIRKRLGTNFSLLQQRVKQDMIQTFPPGEEYGDLEMTPSGTLRVKADYFSHPQLGYANKIGPGAFKAVWVAKRDFPWASGQEQNIRIPDLVGEGALRIQWIEDDLLDTVEDNLKGISLGDKENALSNLQSLANELAYYGLDDIEALVMKAGDFVVNNEDTDDAQDKLDALIELVEKEAEEVAQHASSNWGNDSVSSIGPWVRIETRDKGQLEKLIS